MIKVRYSLLSVFKGQDNIFQSYLSPNKPQISFYHSSTKSCNLWKHLCAWAVKDGLFLHDLPHRYCLIQELQKNSTWCSLPTYSFTLLAAQWVRCSLQPNPWQSTLLIFVTFTIASEFPPSFFFFFLILSSSHPFFPPTCFIWKMNNSRKTAKFNVSERL